MPSKLTHEEFVSRLFTAHPSLQTLGKFVGTNKQILVKCLECEHEWASISDRILRGKGCPKCVMKEKHNNFTNELADITKQIKVLSPFTGIKERISVRCLKCKHEWSPVADNLLQGYGCPNCAKNHKLTHKNFVVRLQNINPNIKVLGKYQSMQKRVKVKCLKCEYEWSPVAGKILHCGCPECSGNRKLTTLEFKERLKTINSDIRVLGKYQSMQKRIKVQCLIPECKHEWSPIADSILRGNGCPKCANRIKLTNEDFVERLKNVSPNIELVGKYQSLQKRVKVKCMILECKHEWSPTAGNLLQNTGCPNCAILGRRKTHEEYENQLASIFGDSIKVLEKYITGREKIKHTCKEGHVWLSKPTALLSKKSGCPVCYLQNSKIGIEFLEKLSIKYNLDIQHHKNGGEVFLECKNNKRPYRPDGFVHIMRMVVEFLGDHWHGFNRKSAFEINQYVRSIKRFNNILAEGYPILYIWEHEFKNNETPWLIMPKKDKKLIRWAKKNSIPYKITTEMVEI